jgi:hypothetical protein
MNWLFYALLTVATWGLYGVYLHSGQLAMGDPINGRYKAFLFVGVAYFIIAVLAPLLVLKINGGALGAIGAFGILLAFGAKGTPTVVMAIVFACAPIVNALASILMHPPKGGWGGIAWQFWLGATFAIAGGFLVSYYKPAPAPKAAKTLTTTAAPAALTNR